MRIAEPWPMNPDGEPIFGVKIENLAATSMSTRSSPFRGVAFVEHGPGDNGFYFLGRPAAWSAPRPAPPRWTLSAPALLPPPAKNNVKFLHGCNENTVEALIKEGVMICTGGDTQAADRDGLSRSAQIPGNPARWIDAKRNKAPARGARALFFECHVA